MSLDISSANIGEGLGLFGGSAPESVAAEGGKVLLSQKISMSDIQLMQDGHDLIVMDQGTPKATVEGYFLESTPPTIEMSGLELSPKLVSSFVKTMGGEQFAQADSVTPITDASIPVGQMDEVNGEVVIVRTDGTEETATAGMPVYEGDSVETFDDGTATVKFADETTFAISDNARLVIDEYAFESGSGVGESQFSMLRGLFMYTSGMIGKNDPGAVDIETPVGSIGIRGTVIAGKLDPDAGSNEITLVQGAIRVANNGGEVLISDPFGTVQIPDIGSPIQDMGAIDPVQVFDTFGGLNPQAAQTIMSMAPDVIGAARPDGMPQPAAGVNAPNAPATGDGSARGGANANGQAAAQQAAEGEAAAAEGAAEDASANEAAAADDAAETETEAEGDADAGDENMEGSADDDAGAEDVVEQTAESLASDGVRGDGQTPTDGVAEGAADSVTAEGSQATNNNNRALNGAQDAAATEAPSADDGQMMLDTSQGIMADSAMMDMMMSVSTGDMSPQQAQMMMQNMMMNGAAMDGGMMDNTSMDGSADGSSTNGSTTGTSSTGSTDTTTTNSTGDNNLVDPNILDEERDGLLGDDGGTNDDGNTAGIGTDIDTRTFQEIPTFNDSDPNNNKGINFGSTDTGGWWLNKSNYDAFDVIDLGASNDSLKIVTGDAAAINNKLMIADYIKGIWGGAEYDHLSIDVDHINNFNMIDATSETRGNVIDFAGANINGFEEIKFNFNGSSSGGDENFTLYENEILDIFDLGIDTITIHNVEGAQGSFTIAGGGNGSTRQIDYITPAAQLIQVIDIEDGGTVLGEIKFSAGSGNITNYSYLDTYSQDSLIVAEFLT